MIPALWGCAGFPKEDQFIFRDAVNTAIEHIIQEDYASAQHVLENQGELYRKDIGYETLLAIAQAGNNDIKTADKTFRGLITRFENHANVIFTVRDRLKPLFASEAYVKLKKRLYAFAELPLFGNPDLYAVDGFLGLAEQDFSRAYQSFKKVLPRHKDKQQKYENLMDDLRQYSERSEDMVSASGYKYLRDLFREPQN
jgi:hypothetical protein